MQKMPITGNDPLREVERPHGIERHTPGFSNKNESLWSGTLLRTAFTGSFVHIDNVECVNSISRRILQ